jgi:hypothetical protein
LHITPRNQLCWRLWSRSSDGRGQYRARPVHTAAPAAAPAQRFLRPALCGLMRVCHVPNPPRAMPIQLYRPYSPTDHTILPTMSPASAEGPSHISRYPSLRGNQKAFKRQKPKAYKKQKKPEKKRKARKADGDRPPHEKPRKAAEPHTKAPQAKTRYPFPPWHNVETPVARDQ